MGADHPRDRRTTDATGWSRVLGQSSSRFANRVQQEPIPIADAAVALDDMRDPRWLRAASDRVAAAMSAPRPVVADALLLYGLVVPRVVPVVAALAMSGAPLELDETRTHVTLLPNGSVDRLWLAARNNAPQEPRSCSRDALDEAGSHVLALVSPLAEAATSTLRIGKRQVWRLVGDLVVRTVHDVLGDRGRTSPLADGLLAACGPPVVFEPRWEHVSTARGTIERPRSRSCCLGYQIDALPYCAGCPREREPARTARLVAYLST